MQKVFPWLSDRFELSRGNGGQNIQTMEGLRGFAVFLVFLVHFSGLAEPLVDNVSLFETLSCFHLIGNVGVDLFFVLSGYLIYGSLISRQQTFLKFMARRIQRIYPAFLVVFCIYVGLSFSFPEENKIPPSFDDGAIYLIQNLLFLPGIFPIQPLITVAWTLSYEVFYYLVIPLVIGAFSMRLRPPSWRISFFSLLAVGFTCYCAVYGGPVRLVMFITGIILFEVINNLQIKAKNDWLGLCSLFLGILSPLLPVGGTVGDSVKAAAMFMAFFVVCLTAFNDRAGWLSRWFSWRPMRWLGNMSYSYYLIHGLALKAGFLVFSKLLTNSDYEAVSFFALLVVMFGLSLVPAFGLFLCVERPFSLRAKPH